jgi:hypothetical protein
MHAEDGVHARTFGRRVSYRIDLRLHAKALAQRIINPIAPPAGAMEVSGRSALRAGRP